MLACLREFYKELRYCDAGMSEDNRTRLVIMLLDVGYFYYEAGKLLSHETGHGHDVHSFYRLKADDGKDVIHVQVYPGMSNDEYARVWARRMDHARLMLIRESSPQTSFGNEHDAVVRSFPSFGSGVLIPYDAKVLEQMLEAEVPELR